MLSTYNLREINDYLAVANATKRLHSDIERLLAASSTRISSTDRLSSYLLRAIDESRDSLIFCLQSHLLTVIGTTFFERFENIIKGLESEDNEKQLAAFDELNRALGAAALVIQLDLFKPGENRKAS